ncbi:putative short chain dehydrogenase reductase family protein [Lasiodiplodia theobromae]|uniref:Putative oxidoreductase n=1 Tax=Lasiodiplodia theobromae TaxID=45133 RepID=A0A5N5DHT6_9PEZI|nr:Short chain dehydrogenase reductase [Lasiodiplodia theobromae]KAB2577433.1 putative oxidoreductase [Lasiodiplodia theobromae]KAF4540424.1 Short chain dehydrogenase reductase [Lasiodiplodia theobromae]KAF9640378.1 putative short chain dehydrogenase reductase family protein [Lasiodiplodia theobromae]
MPVYIAVQALFDGIGSIPYAWTIIKTLPWLALLVLLKRYFGGVVNTSERNMHSKVVMITGGTAGIGAQVARDLATRGAQLVLLTQHELSDPFIVDYIDDLRETTNNSLITAEQVDLSSLHSIRKFATKWVDNAPPRRLDMIILCANTFTPAGAKVRTTEDGLEESWGVNYIANFHLLSILSPALRAQPPDRDVRVIFSTCSSYMGGQLPDFSQSDTEKEKKPAKTNKSKKADQPKQVLEFKASSADATSKLASMVFASAFQKHLATYNRPDKFPMNSRVFVVDPGWTRTPGMRRHLSFGSLWGLALYLIMWPFWWLVLKSPVQGAQTYLYAAMDAQLGRAEGGKFLKECREVRFMRGEIEDEKVQKGLWQASEKTIEELEKKGAMGRAQQKKKQEDADKAKKQAEELAALEELVKKAKAAKEQDSKKEKQSGSKRNKKSDK